MYYISSEFENKFLHWNSPLRNVFLSSASILRAAKRKRQKIDSKRCYIWSHPTSKRHIFVLILFFLILFSLHYFWFWFGWKRHHTHGKVSAKWDLAQWAGDRSLVSIWMKSLIKYQPVQCSNGKRGRFQRYSSGTRTGWSTTRPSWSRWMHSLPCQYKTLQWCALFRLLYTHTHAHFAARSPPFGSPSHHPPLSYILSFYSIVIQVDISGHNDWYPAFGGRERSCLSCVLVSTCS